MDVKPSELQLDRLRSTLRLQFPQLDTDQVLEQISISISRKTGRIRGVHDLKTDVQLFSLRTSDGRYLPTFSGAVRIQQSGYNKQQVVMTEEAVPFVAAGKSAFCKHVLQADLDIAPQSEVLVVDPEGQLLAVGTAQQPGYAMLELESGIAVKIKHCRDKTT